MASKKSDKRFNEALDKTKAAIERIKADPLASAEQVKWLRSMDVLAALNHPNCPVDLWWELAVEYPVEAEESVLFRLFTLEDPVRWKALEEEGIRDWIDAAIQKLPWVSQVKLAADCAAHVLHVYEREYPGNKRPRQAIEAAQRCALDPSPQNKAAAAKAAVAAKAAYVAAAKAYNAADEDELDQAADAANAAFFAAISCAGEGASNASNAASNAADSYAAERKWQWIRVRQYLGGTVSGRVGARTKMMRSPVPQNPRAKGAPSVRRGTPPMKRNTNTPESYSTIGADKFELLSDQLHVFDYIPRDKNLELLRDAVRALSIASKVPQDVIINKSLTDKQTLMLLETAYLAMSLRPAVTTYQVRPAAAKIVNNTQLNYVPHAPPKPLLHPAVITVTRVDKGERLTGNVVSIGWAWFESSIRIHVQEGPTAKDPGGNLHIFTWDPVWSGEALPNAKDIQDAPFLDELERKGLTVCADALRFLVVFTILLGAEQTPLRVETEKFKRAETKGGVTPSTWVTRHIYLSEQPVRRDRASQEETEQALREGLTLEDVEVRGFIRRQHYGPGNKEVKEIYVKGFLSTRWVAADKKRRIVVH